MKKKIFFNVLVSVLVSLSFISCSKDAPNELDTERLQAALDSAFAESPNGKGVSAAIIVPGQDVWLGVSGISYGTVAITTDMIFSIGSTTKNFTAALILQLMEEGTLTLEDSLHEWLPNYPNIDSTITIQQLLNHTSGIFDMTTHPAIWDSVFADLDRLWTPEEILNNFILESYFFPGSGWHYSNTGYILLGMIIKEATGSEVSTELRNRFLNPLGLNSTFLDVEEVIPGEIAHGWEDINGDNILDDFSLFSRTSIYSGAWTAGAMVSTAEDLARWALALFQGGLLSQATLHQMLTFQSPCPGEPLLDGYGLGVCQFFIEGIEMWGHAGYIPGYLSIVRYIPDSGVIISVLINSNSEECITNVYTALLRVVLDHL